METKRLIIAFLWVFLFGCWVFLFAYQLEGGSATVGTQNPVIVRPTTTTPPPAPKVIKPTIPTTPLNR